MSEKNWLKKLTLKLDHLFETVETVFVGHLPQIRADALILHPRLHQIDGVDGRGPTGAADGSQGEAVDLLEGLNEKK
jgi:hypothetical protein